MNAATQALPPLDIDAPEPVRVATRAAHESGDKLVAARAELQAAESDVPRAAAVDKAADAQAAALGKELPTPKATPPAIEAREAAKRKLDACELLHAERFATLTEAIIANREEWEARLKAEIEAAQTSALEALDTYHQAYERVAAARRVAGYLPDFLPGPRDPWVAKQFAVTPSHSRRERKRERFRQSAASGARRPLGAKDLERIMVDLELLVAEPSTSPATPRDW